MTDFTALSRTQWLDLAERFYARLEQELSAFKPSDWERVTPYLGWRNRDLLAHMASAISINFREVLDRALAGDPSAPPEFDTFTRNAREVARRYAVPVAHVLREFWSGLDAILALYKDMSDGDWLKPAWFFVGTVNVRTLFLAQLGDNLFHERDLLRVTGRWHGFDPEVATPLLDWLLREVRTASFRPQKAVDLRATILFRLTGAVSGEWTMEIANGQCLVEQRTTPSPDAIIEADPEDLVAASQGRAAPFIGRLARRVDWVLGPDRHEEVVAAITGYESALSSVLSGRIHISGNRALANRVNAAFWHFWQRTEQTEYNIELARASLRIKQRQGPLANG